MPDEIPFSRKLDFFIFFLISYPVFLVKSIVHFWQRVPGKNGGNKNGEG